MEWHYSKNGQQHGPVSKDELRSLIAGGSVSASDHVWNKSMTDWKPVRDIPELSDKPRQVAPPQQAPSPQAPQKLSQEKKAEIHRLKEQMKKEYEMFVKETHTRAIADHLNNMNIGLFKKREKIYEIDKGQTDKTLEWRGCDFGWVDVKNPVEVFYYESDNIKYSRFEHTRITYENDKKQLKFEQQAEAALKVEGKGKYDPELPSLDDFMEWRWRDMDNKGELADGLIDAVQRSQ